MVLLLGIPFRGFSQKEYRPLTSKTVKDRNFL